MTLVVLHRRRRPRRQLTGLVLALVLLLTVSCTSEQPTDAPGPDQQIAAFISDWQQLHPGAAADLTSDPAAAALMLGEVNTNLHPDSLTITTGSVNRTGPDTATTTATFSWELPNAGTWTYPATWTWQRASSNSDWLLDWSPTVVHPKLSERQTLAIRTSDPQQGVMVDRNNNQIVSPVRVFSVVLLPGTVPDVAATAAVLAPVLAPLDPTITADGIAAGAAAAGPPQLWRPLLRRQRIQQVRTPVAPVLPSPTHRRPPDERHRQQLPLLLTRPPSATRSSTSARATTSR